MIKSYAKLNLFLHITGKTPNNYHYLQSIFVLLNLCDYIRIEENGRNEFNVKVFDRNGHIIEIEDNIVYKSINTMLEYKKIPGFDIYIDKYIPIQSGLGGGSSNAAAVLQYINSTYEIGIKQEELLMIGKNIGADLPFFLSGMNYAFIEGIGDIIHALPLTNTKYFILIITPQFGIMTSEAYNMIDTYRSSIGLEVNIDTLSKLNNDLFIPACKIRPELRDVIELISSNDGCLFTRMSGSGSSCFGIFNEVYKRDLAIERIKSIADTKKYHIIGDFINI